MRLRALVFDDDEKIRSLLTLILESRGYTVLSFPDPTCFSPFREAVCPCPPDHVCCDILITDNVMPNMKGLDFISERIRNGCRGIVRNKAVMSGTWSAVDLAYARSLGCRVFEKPFSVGEILGWLDECEKRTDPSRKLVEWPGVSLNYAGAG